MTYVYRADQELPAIPLNWVDGTGAIIDYSTGWTFTVKICLATAPTTTLATKTTGITGAATAPNVTIDWVTADFTGLTAAAAGTSYVVHVTARRTSDSKDRVFNPGAPLKITLVPAPS
jgi:hypothetical protein